MTTGNPTTIITTKTPLPSLSTLSRNALLYGLASGCGIVIPENSYLGEEFWENLVHEGAYDTEVCRRTIYLVTLLCL
jgi:hypothetical protein